MGNIGSQTKVPPSQTISLGSEQAWSSHSFIRGPQRLNQHRVLPAKDSFPKLRHTDNGEILHSGGTLSGRTHQSRLSFQEKGLSGVFRSNSFTSENQNEYQENVRVYRDRETVQKSGHKYEVRNRYGCEFSKEQMKRFGSEPDLRNSSIETLEHSVQHDKSRSKKKYKAPLPPVHSDISLGENETNRRLRLYKTQAETKKQLSSPVNNIKDLSRVSENKRAIIQNASDFEAQLREATKRLRSVASNKEKLKTLDPNINRIDIMKHKVRQMEEKKRIEEAVAPLENVRGQASGKESTPEPSPVRNLEEIKKNLPKAFYFGMDAPIEVNQSNNNVLINSSSSDISSELDVEESQNSSDVIALKLRPVLPKKQLEIPRFSPSAAWKSLSALEPCDDVENIEKRLQRTNSSINHDLGDAFRYKNSSWTPQQDLGDDSSIEDISFTSPRFHSKTHVFSLSLPRDQYISRGNTSLQKIKRSVSGVLATMATKKDVFQSNSMQDKSDNWFLSKSAPNSLNNGFSSLEMRNSRVSSDEDNSGILTAPTTSGRLMYLPSAADTQPKISRIRSKSSNRLTSQTKRMSAFSKSCENISSGPEDLQDRPKLNYERAHKPRKFTFQSTIRQIERKRLAEKLSAEAERKEKQRLRELEAMQKVEEEFQKKRAKEKANIRQQLRLFTLEDTGWSSLPPNIENKQERSEPDGSSTSSPTISKEVKTNKKFLNIHHKYSSSSDSSEENKVKASVTQVLSEYRQPQREYKEFRRSARYLIEFSEPKETIHPQVTCNMPKAKSYQTKSSFEGPRNSSNYRKDFAHGVKATSKSGGSTYSEDSNTRNYSMPR